VGKIVMNSNAVENININPIESGVTVTLEHSKDSVTVTPDISEWVKEVHVNYSVIADADKQMEHWRKRELDAAMRCGENLVNIRQQYGKLGHGFKTFIATEFANEFSYETCLRYMKLFNGRSQLTPEINSLRKAYIHLGILKQDYAYPKPIIEVDDSTSTDQSNACDNSRGDGHQPDANKSERSAPRKKTTQDILSELIGSNEAFLMKMPAISATNPQEYFVLEYMVDQNGDMLGRIPGNGGSYKVISSKSYSVLRERIKPIVEWYLSRDLESVRILDNNVEGDESISISV
jgi:hypothetical protein